MPMGLESVSDFPSFGGAGGRGFKSGDFSWLLVIRHRRQAPKKKKKTSAIPASRYIGAANTGTKMNPSAIREDALHSRASAIGILNIYHIYISVSSLFVYLVVGLPSKKCLASGIISPNRGKHLNKKS